MVCGASVGPANPPSPHISIQSHIIGNILYSLYAFSLLLPLKIITDIIYLSQT